MISYDAIISGDARKQADVRYLKAAAQSACRDYQATRYEQAASRLVGLIGAVEASKHAGPSAKPTCELRALVYDTTAALLSRVGAHALAWAAADRAMTAAENTGEPLLAAAAAYRLSYVLTGRRHPRAALHLAATTAQAIQRHMRPVSPEQLSIYGGLHLAAATAAAATYDQAATRDHLREADSAARRLGEDANLMGTAFGPANVAIHTMATALQLGDPAAAIRVGESLDSRALSPGLTGRRTQICLNLARGYAIRRQDAASVNMLLAAEKISPQLVRFDPVTRDVVASLLHREHRPSTPELRPLARRAGVI